MWIFEKHDNVWLINFVEPAVKWEVRHVAFKSLKAFCSFQPETREEYIDWVRTYKVVINMIPALSRKWKYARKISKHETYHPEAWFHVHDYARYTNALIDARHSLKAWYKSKYVLETAA